MRRMTFYLLMVLCIKTIAGTLEKSDSIVLNAMRDELSRNMNDLQYADYNKTFFISYTIGKIEEIYVSSSLGALMNSKRDTSKTWAARVMVGDYDINDENYEDYSNIDENEMDPITLPVDDDYLGIRRTLWTVTNYIYKKAGMSYKNKMLALKQNNLNDSVLQIADFARTEQKKIYEPPVKLKVKKSELEDLTRNLSGIFINYPEIIKSAVTVDAFNSRIYFNNSEGTESVTSEVVFTIQVSAILMGNEGEMINNSFAYHVSSFDELPPVDSIKNNIRLLAENLIKLKNASTLEENYYGPVMFTGQVVAEIFEQNLFSGSDRLIAQRDPLINSPQMKMYFGNPEGSIEDKIDKRITSSNLSIFAYPKMKEYNGIKLLGSYEIDAEGVVPPEKLTLVENGILKTLLNDRTPTRKLNTSNGHKRYSISYGGMSKETGPGVISVSSNNSMSYAALKEKLIEYAKMENLKYGILIKPLLTNNSYQTANIYKVWVDNGREELVSSAYFKDLPSNSLKRIIGTSNGQIVYNTFSGSGSLTSSQALSRGLMVTYLVPDAILFEESEIINIRKPVLSTKPITKSPVELLNSKVEE